jgi:hypothetical protein
MVVLLSILVLVQLATFVPAIYAQKNYQAEIQKFKVLWNTGRSMILSKQGVDPNKAEEEIRRQAHLKEYVGKSFFYNVWLVPMWAGPLAFFANWLLSPGWISLLLSLWVLLYAGLWLEKSWSRQKPFAGVIALSVMGSFLYYLWVTVLWDVHAEIPYCGVGLASAVAVGILAHIHRDPIPFQGWWLKPRQIQVHPLIFAGIWIVLDFVVQVFVNPLNYGWVFVLDLGALGLGWALAPKIPLLAPVKATIPLRTMDPLQQTRKYLQEGWRLAELLELDAALGQIERGMQGLLAYSKPDPQMVEGVLEKLLNNNYCLPVGPELWYQWGVRMSELGFFKSAIACLEKCAQTPGTPSSLARPAVVQATELRIQTSNNPGVARPWLERVVKSGADDLIGRRAAKLLTTIQ